MKTKLVIFDNDGVLVDSEPLIKIAQIEAFASQGANITAEWSYVNLHGLRAADVIKAVENHTGVKVDSVACLARFKQVFDELIDSQLQPTPGIALELEKLRGMGVPMAVATSGPLEETYHKLKATGLDDYFGREAIFSGEQVPNGKPAPDLFLFAAKNMGFESVDCTVVEDAPFGILGAKAAGMHAIGYMGGGHVRFTHGLNAEALYKAGADIVVESHDALLTVMP